MSKFKFEATDFTFTAYSRIIEAPSMLDATCLFYKDHSNNGRNRINYAIELKRHMNTYTFRMELPGDSPNFTHFYDIYASSIEIAVKRLLAVYKKGIKVIITEVWINCEKTGGLKRTSCYHDFLIEKGLMLVN